MAAGPRQEQMRVGTTTKTNSTANPATATLLRFPGSSPPWLIAVTSAVLLLVAFSIVFLVRRRRRLGMVRNNRAFGIRRGMSTAGPRDDEEEEEDLLISSLYS
ncbi:unnamed protein product [Gongylonema pulchrum]|uniref:Uncharacterized protein n=1 Tax=Gongylonema pulchrum TaxID=637853 RepID=A0A183D4C0_9BILA|nr:unnamed protein product [Gongylonema pulchrum]